MLAAGGVVTAVRPAKVPVTTETVIYTYAAGDGEEAQLVGRSGVKNGSVSSKSGSAAGIWAKNSGGSFPLIGIDGQYYRLLTEPANASQSMLTSALGTVTMFSEEPALSGAGTVLSNVCPEGTTIYAVKGMAGTLVGAELNGSLRLFQRVSFNGSACKPGESLADTLQISGKVARMELSGSGTVTDGTALASLTSVLLNNASFRSSGSVKAGQVLIITLADGVKLQLNVQDELFSACGTWSCPEFFTAFAEAAQ